MISTQRIIIQKQNEIIKTYKNILKSKGIIKQNLWISLSIVAILIPATILGIANIGLAVLIHEGSTLVVVFNALRLLAYKETT